jgi:hypothetical protein
MNSNNEISFKRLIDISLGSKMSEGEEQILLTHNTVYVIYNDLLNKVYIGETVDTYIRLFKFWKTDKRHVGGENSPISKIFNKDYENTFFKILEFNCDQQAREYYWDKYYRENTNYIIVSHPGRHGCSDPGNKGLIAIHKDSTQTYINPEDLDNFLSDGWKIGGKRQSPRTDEQKSKMSVSHLGKIPWNKGIKLSEEQKQAYRKPKKIINRRVYNNSQIENLKRKNIGRIKIHKGSSELQVLPEELENYLNNGWIRGTKKRMAKYLKPNGEYIDYSKSSASRNHKDWIFISDL